jgi:hypothetical protein
MNQWFICIRDNVSGPFEANYIRSEIETGALPQDTVLWARGETDWVPASDWIKRQSQVETAQKVVADTEWYYAVDGVSKGPISRDIMVRELLALTNKDQILVWTQGMNTWTDIYEVEDLRSELGLERRESPRISVHGNAELHFEDGEVFSVSLKTISAGGFGTLGAHRNLQTGRHINVHLSAEFLKEPIHAKAEVQYVTEGGYTGFKFVQISDEAKTQVLTYIQSKHQAQLKTA